MAFYDTYLNSGNTKEELENAWLIEVQRMSLDEIANELCRLRRDDKWNYLRRDESDMKSLIDYQKREPADFAKRELSRQRYFLFAKYFRGKCISESFDLLPPELQEEEKKAAKSNIFKRAFS